MTDKKWYTSHLANMNSMPGVHKIFAS